MDETVLARPAFPPELPRLPISQRFSEIMDTRENDEGATRERRGRPV